METRFKVVLLDESRYYDPDFLMRCGAKIMRAFLFDACRPVYCCEIRPSYELIPLGSSCAAQLSDEQYEELASIDAMHNEVEYHLCSYIDALPVDRFYAFQPYTLIEGETYEEVENVYLEEARCNTYIDCPWGPDEEEEQQ